MFTKNGKTSLRNINKTLITRENKAQAIQIMMSALNITIGYVRPTKIFHNKNIPVF